MRTVDGREGYVQIGTHGRARRQGRDLHAPHLDVVSHVHGKYIYEMGYHILPYFLNNWGQFKHVPLGVLAHSTHVPRVRGDGRRRRKGQCPGDAGEQDFT